LTVFVGVRGCVLVRDKAFSFCFNSEPHTQHTCNKTVAKLLVVVEVLFSHFYLILFISIYLFNIYFFISEFEKNEIDASNYKVNFNNERCFQPLMFRFDPRAYLLAVDRFVWICAVMPSHWRPNDYLRQ